MRLDGEHMIVGIKDAVKLVSISIICACAVLVCTMFLNYRMDLLTIRELLSTEQEMILWDAQKATAQVVCLITGGCLLMTSVVTLFFYIKYYIDTHKKELGILKALGYGNGKIAASFWIFGSSVLIGAAAGYLGAHMLIPGMYRLQNKDALLPEVAVRFHPMLFLWMVVLPTVFFSALSIFYARLRLKVPPLWLLRGEGLPGKREKSCQGKAEASRYTENGEKLISKKAKEACEKAPKHRKSGTGQSFTFLRELKRTTLWGKKSLLFFIVFSAFCFSAMTQMSFSMKELSSDMMGTMIMGIGLILAVTTLFLAVTTLVRGNAKTIAMMRTFGYSQRECSSALLGVYRPAAYIGFAIGTVYQYGLLRLMVDIVFRDMEGMPAYHFHVPRMLVSLVCFLILYELMIYGYSEKMRRISIKEIMMESE